MKKGARHFACLTLAAMLLPLWVTGCDDCQGGASYLLPTEWIGVVTRGDADVAAVNSVLANFAAENGLHGYRESTVPFFREQREKGQMRNDADVAHYKSQSSCRGIHVSTFEYGPSCMHVLVADASGRWTAKSLEGVRQIRQSLARTLPGQVSVLVRAKSQQSYPEQLSAHEPDLPPSDQAPCTWKTQYPVEY